MTELTDEQWNELATNLFKSFHGMRPPHGRRRDGMDMRGEPMALIVLHHHAEGMTAGDLAEATHVSTARMAALLNGLEERGFVARAKDDEDRRRTMVTLTEAGKQQVSDLSARRTAHTVAVLRELGAEDAQELVRIAGRLAEIVPAVRAESDDDLFGCGHGHHHGEGKGHGHGEGHCHHHATDEDHGGERAHGHHHHHGEGGKAHGHHGHGEGKAKKAHGPRAGEAQGETADRADR